MSKKISHLEKVLRAALKNSGHSTYKYFNSMKGEMAMYRMKWIVSLVLVVVFCAGSAAWAQTAGVKLKEGIYQETTGNLAAAITIYQAIIDDDEATAFYAATAMYRLGMCQLKGGDREKALATFEQVIAKYPSESTVVDRAREELSKLNSGSEIPENATFASPENLQELIDVAQPGDMIILSPGLYTEPVIITKSLTLKGQSRADCVFEVTTEINQPAIFINTIGPGKARLENLTIKWGRAMNIMWIEKSGLTRRILGGMAGMGMAGLVNDPNSTVDVERHMLINDPNSTVDIVQLPAIPASAPNSEYHEYRGAVGIKDATVEIEGCYLKALGQGGQAPVGLSLRGFADVTITRSRIEGFGFNLMFWEGTMGKVQDCLIMDSDEQGIMLKENSIVDFVGNVICGAKKANGLRSSGGTLTVKNNLIIDNAWMGIKLGDTPSFGSITNNVIMGNNSGITSYNNDSVVNIANNVITGCRSCGVYMYSKSDLTVKDNIFQGNNRALALRSTLEGQNTNTVLLNTLWENEINFIMWDGADTFGNYGPEPEVFWEAPGFVDPENGYFAVSNPVLIDNEQGLTDPEVFTVLWMRWQNRADVNEPFGIR